MLDKINSEIVSSRKSRDSHRTKVLSFLKSKLEENSKSKSPKKDLEVIKHHRKQLDKSKTQYVSRPEVLTTLDYEIGVISEFIPEGPSRNYIEQVVKGIVQTAGDHNTGSVMKAAAPILKDADRSLLVEVIKENLK